MQLGIHYRNINCEFGIIVKRDIKAIKGNQVILVVFMFMHSLGFGNEFITDF